MFIFRLTLAVVVGILIGSMTIWLADTLNARIFPSNILNPTIEEQAELIKNAPFLEYLFVLGGFIFGSFFGAYAAGRIAPSPHKIISGLTVGFFFLLGGIIYFVNFAQPVWLMLASSVSFMLFSYIGSRVANHFSKP